jgi:hypothetical protein
LNAEPGFGPAGIVRLSLKRGNPFSFEALDRVAAQPLAKRLAHNL